VWEVEYLAESGRKMVSKGMYSSNLNSNCEAEEILSYAYSKTLDFGKKAGDLVKIFLSCNYKVILGGYR
jgi:hypothetical protein